MKQSHLFAIGSLFTMALSLSACKQEASQGTPLRVAMRGEASPSASVGKLRFVKRNVTSPADQCFNELCSDSTASSMEALLKAAEAATPEQQDYFKKNLLPLLQQKAQNAQKLAQTRLERLESQEKNFASVTLNPAQEKLIKTFLLLYYPDTLDKTIVENFSKALYATDFQSARNVFQNRKGSSYLQTLYKGKTLSEATQLETAYIQGIQSKLNEALGGSIMNIDNASFNKALKKETLNAEDIQSISNIGYGAHLYDFFLLGEGTTYLEKILLKSDDLMKLYEKSSIKANLREKMGAQDQAIASCEKKFYQTLNLYPQQRDLDAFKALTEIVRKEVASLVGPQDPAYEKIMSTTIVFPLLASEAAQDWSSRLQDDMTYEKNEAERFAKYDDATLFTLAIVQATANNQRNHLCGELVDLDISDRAFAADQSIALSWLSVKRPKLGISLLAHELGHIADQYSKSFANEHLCLRDKQSADQYAGEDFADWFSAKVAVQIEKNEHMKAENFGCFLGASDQTLSLKNSDSSDPHSSHLFRTLQIAGTLGQKIPQSCTDLAKQESSKAPQVCQ